MKLVQTKPQKTIKSAVEKYFDYISPTYGPTGKKTLIVHNEFNHEAVDDGKRSAQNFEIENEFENAVAQYIKETTQKGKDGTTTAAILMSAIVKEALKDIDNELVKPDYHGISLSLKKGLSEAVKQIKPTKIKTKEELYAIAHNSYNNKEVADLIADTVFKIGKDGVLSIEDSRGTDTTVEIVNGLEVAKGYHSPYLINSDDKVTLENPAILLVNKRINLFAEVAPMIQEVVETTKDIVIVADGFGDDVVNKCIAFKMAGQLRPLLIEAPGVDKLESLSDIAAVTGAKVVDEKTVKMADAVGALGTCESIKSLKDKTIILGGKGKTKDYIATLKVQLENETSEFGKDKLTKRIAALSGGVAVIKVGAYTENEQKGMKTKIENAVNATQIAYKGGVVPGAGKALADIETSSPILNVALKAPRKQLEENGKEYLDENTVDPADVVITALETAVSIASTLITIGGISVPKRKKDKEDEY